MRINSLLTEGLDVISQQKASREETKIGKYRGGSAGCLVGGEFYGSCPRETLLRFIGMPETVTLDEYMYFCAGFGHESNLLNLLINAKSVRNIEVWDKPDYYGIESSKLIYHEDSISSNINGIEFSGRPDFVVTMQNDYRFGIEAKVVITKKRALACSKAPFVNAICQASAYSQVLGIPYHIVYGSYTVYDEFTFKKIDEKFDWVDYKQFPKGIYVKIPPKLFEYEVLTKGGSLCIIDDQDNVIKTKLTEQGIWDYYKSITEAIDTKTLPGVLTDYEVNSKPSYKKCDYCSYKSYCTAYDNNIIDYDKWVEGCLNNGD